ncbi:MAG TPA: LacI family DNA-binding transcriptional regulator [Lacunisphaera sp.]|jgi:LacI family transcriptional regulator
MSEIRVTLSDIARKAGVHVTTVSQALRNHPSIATATRERLQALALEMKYRPDPFLRSLVAYRTRHSAGDKMPTLAYVTNWHTRWGWKKVAAHSGFFAGAEAKATELGFRLEHFWLHEPGLTQKRLAETLAARRIDGVIIASHSRELGDQLQLDWEHLSAVKIDYFPHEPRLHNVTNNQCNIIRLAMRRLMGLGYRRMGFVVHRGWDHAVDNNWTAGYLTAQQELAPTDRLPAHVFPEMHPVSRWFHETDASVRADSDPFRNWLDRHRPDVVIAKAAYVLPLIREMGLKIPQDIAFADLFLEESRGSIGGVRQNHDRVGATAVEIVAGQLQHHKFGIPTIPIKTYVDGTWFDGASCPPRNLANAASGVVSLVEETVASH